VSDQPERHLAKAVDRGLSVAEDLVYTVVAVLLVGGAILVLASAGYRLVLQSDEGIGKAIETTLDRLLLVFILVELLGAVRTIIGERKLVAEPFLLVGVIASIREIVILAALARESFGAEDGRFDDTIITIGILGGVLIALGVTAFLLRRKEREPEEPTD
jgi:uncharacterized membrane protein (DUF373 family)